MDASILNYTVNDNVGEFLSKDKKLYIGSISKAAYYILGQGSQKFYLQKLVHNLKLDDYVVFLGFSKNPYKCPIPEGVMPPIQKD